MISANAATANSSRADREGTARNPTLSPRRCRACSTGRRSQSRRDVVVAQLREQAEVERPLDLDPAQRAKVRGQVLQLEQAAARLQEPRDEIGECDLGRIRLAVEHRLAAEHAADEHAVDAADQAVVRPDLEAVRVPERVQPGIRSRQLAADPRAVLARARLTASLDDRLERLVDASRSSRSGAACAPASARHAGDRAGGRRAVAGRTTARRRSRRAATGRRRTGRRRRASRARDRRRRRRGRTRRRAPRTANVQLLGPTSEGALVRLAVRLPRA